MARQPHQKLKLLYILDILKKHSDEEHPLNASQIAEKLSLYGIEAERKSIYDDILCLEIYGTDIIKSSNKQGWFIGSREFEIPEINLLCDAVKSADFISASKTRELISKLNNMLSENDRQKQSSVFFDPKLKCKNEEIYYTIDKLNTAIKNEKQVKLKYSSRFFSNNREVEKKTKEMLINPYALTWQDDHYYLVGNYAKYNNLIHLRVDRMSSVEICETASRHFSDVSEYTDYFDIADYTEKLFLMHTGELYDVEFCCNKAVTEQVLDRFGEDIFIKNVTEDSFSFKTKLTLSEALVTWILNFGENMTVKSPERLKEMIKLRIKNVLKNYED